MFSLPGGSNGGLPIGNVAFWFLIILTVLIVIGFVWLLIYAVDQMEVEQALALVRGWTSSYSPGSNLPTG